MSGFNPTQRQASEYARIERLLDHSQRASISVDEMRFYLAYKAAKEAERVDWLTRSAEEFEGLVS